MLKESICKLTIFWNSAQKNIPDRRQCVHSRKSKKIWHKSLHSYIVHIFLSGSWFLSSVVVSSLCTFLPAMLVYSVHSAASFQPSVLLFCSLSSFLPAIPFVILYTQQLPSSHLFCYSVHSAALSSSLFCNSATLFLLSVLLVILSFPAAISGEGSFPKQQENCWQVLGTTT